MGMRTRTLAWARLIQEVRPGHDVYWGWPGEGPPQTTVWSLTFEQAWHNWSHAALHVVLRSSNIDVTVPVSLFSQMFSVVGRLGGFLAAFNAVFFIIFRRG